jgi:hypothetical protein
LRGGSSGFLIDAASFAAASGFRPDSLFGPRLMVYGFRMPEDPKYPSNPWGPFADDPWSPLLDPVTGPAWDRAVESARRTRLVEARAVEILARMERKRLERRGITRPFAAA